MMDIDNEQLTQIQDDWEVAQQLRDEFYCDDTDLMETDSVDIAFVQSDGIADYWRHLRSVRCKNCQKPLKIDATDLVKRTKQMLKEAHVLHPCFFCPHCSGWCCVGCDLFHATALMSTQKHVASARTFKSTWCCDKGRLFLIFCLLCGVDPPASQLTSQPSPAPKKVKYARSTSQPSSSKKARREGFRKSKLPKGIGYGDGSISGQPARGSLQPTGSDNIEDLELYFQGLASLLPSPTKGTTEFDSLPQPLVSAMVWRSPVLQHASEILRQAAIEEINARYGPVTAVLDFLETAGSHPDTQPALVQPRILFPPSEQLISVALEQQNEAGAEDHETTQSLAATVENLAVSCRRFMDNSTRLSNPQDEEGARLLAVVQKICTIASWLGSCHGDLAVVGSQEICQPSTSSAGQSSHSTTRVATSVGLQDVCTASKWHRTNCVKEVPDETILKDFHYRSAALAAADSRPAPQRMRKLLAQVSSLSTDLPDGIYVRHGESRLDVLKVLIVGPVDTPYEHGLFEFDMFCPSEFPQSSPRMFFRTTGGGTVTFNPNLYSNGRVCLSLLGTWGGQSWEPDRSSILQILVSIQAMIFNDKPYHNEPGYEYHEPEQYKKQIEQYNRQVEQKTVDHAILGWLTERLASPHSAGTAISQSASRICSPAPPAQGTAQGTVDLTNLSVPGPTHLPHGAPSGAHVAKPLASQLQAQHLTTQFHGHPAGATIVQTPLGGFPFNEFHHYLTIPGQQVSSTYPPPSGTVAALPAPEYHEPLPVSQPPPPNTTDNQPGSDDSLLLEVFSPFESAVIAGHIDSGGAIIQDASLWVDMILTGPVAANIAKPHQAPQPPATSRRVPQCDDPIWGDVIRKHFELKGRLIVETVKKWENQALAAKGDAACQTTLLTSLESMAGAGLKVMAELARHGFVH
ncbi:hypothetical protein N657DRAFT_326782 [Parathielavia appendiculata]|uniref:UBC core domain-containing protein n=1 Tax=Parathielavia appendiculata TaxID=2587402 RepID=A0AAN6TRG5_9PEZI|nr:hypothetical protein N657DRAFT_326782 [Parathielavia appendiculata]